MAKYFTADNEARSPASGNDGRGVECDARSAWERTGPVRAC